MNAKPLVIQGTDRIIAYACGRCGLVHKEAARAEKCCPTYVCRYCGATMSPYHMACDACQDLVRLRAAKRVSPETYDVAMVCVDDDHYIATEDIESAVEDGEITTPFVWGCDYTPLRLDVESAMENELEEHHEDAEFDCVAELEAFLEVWNAKQTDGSFYVDYKTVVVLDADRLDAMLREFEFRAAMLGEVLHAD